jgi:hypothetical protein
VIAAGLIGLLGAVLLEPVHADEEHRGVSLLVRAVPALLLPLVPLAAWALLARLDQYGWTEFRYVRFAAVLSIGILAVLGTIRLIRRRPPLLTTVPAVFAAVLLLSALGPWSAPAVSRRDQTARLRAALREAGVDPRRLPRDTVTVDSAVFQRITSGARYLADSHGVRALQAVVAAVPDTMAWRIAEVLRIRGGCGPDPDLLGEIAWEGGVPGVMGGTLYEVVLIDTAARQVQVGGAAMRLRLRGDALVVEAPGWRGEADLSGVRRALQARSARCGEWDRPMPRLSASEALLPLRDDAGALRGQVVVQHMAITSGPTAPRRAPAPPGITSVRALLVLPQQP